jgi:hypothetical protein
MMNQFKTRGEAVPRSETFVELRIDDLVRESVTWSPQTTSGTELGQQLPSVIHGPLASSELH